MNWRTAHNRRRPKRPGWRVYRGVTFVAHGDILSIKLANPGADPAPAPVATIDWPVALGAVDGIITVGGTFSFTDEPECGCVPGHRMGLYSGTCKGCGLTMTAELALMDADDSRTLLAIAQGFGAAVFCGAASVFVGGILGAVMAGFAVLDLVLTWRLLVRLDAQIRG